MRCGRVGADGGGRHMLRLSPNTICFVFSIGLVRTLEARAMMQDARCNRIHRADRIMETD